MKKLIRIIATTLGLLVLYSGIVNAQSKDKTSTTEHQSISPFEMARVINRSRRAWSKDRVALDVDLAPTWEQLKIEPGQFAGCAGDCEAKVFRHELNSVPGREVILELTQSFNSCRYLIFARAKDNPTHRLRWKLLGHIDHDFNRYQMASHRIVRAFGRNWFVLRGQEGSGSGYYLYGETWFEVSSRGVRPVLNYSADGHTDPVVGGLKWELKGRPSASKRPNNERAIRLIFEVFYTGKGFDNENFTRHFTVHRHADYLWSKRESEFVFDPRHSTISEREMNAVANVESEPPEEERGVKVGGSTFFSGLKGFVGSGFEMFVRLNAGRLRQIARGANRPAKDWLREFLKQCDEIPEKRVLEIALKDQLSQSSKRR